MTALDNLSEEGNRETRAAAVQLYAAATQSTFIISLFLIAKYSALLEPVVNVLQSKSLDLFKCGEHIKRILTDITDHRQNADSTTNLILDDAKKMAENLHIELKLPRNRWSTTAPLKSTIRRLF